MRRVEQIMRDASARRSPSSILASRPVTFSVGERVRVAGGTEIGIVVRVDVTRDGTRIRVQFNDGTIDFTGRQLVRLRERTGPSTNAPSNLAREIGLGRIEFRTGRTFIAGERVQLRLALGMLHVGTLGRIETVDYVTGRASVHWDTGDRSASISFDILESA